MATRKKRLRRKLIMDSKCVQCENKSDLLFAFTGYKICGKCAFSYLKTNSKEEL